MFDNNDKNKKWFLLIVVSLIGYNLTKIELSAKPKSFNIGDCIKISFPHKSWEKTIAFETWIHKIEGIEQDTYHLSHYDATIDQFVFYQVGGLDSIPISFTNTELKRTECPK